MTQQADLILHGASCVDPAEAREGDAVAVRGDRILAVGPSRVIAAMAGSHTRMIDCAGCTLLPGLIDGHAHMDREGLKSILPSLAGAGSVQEVMARIADEAARREPGEWIVTMPLGTPPLYLDGHDPFGDGTLPSRHDLDRAAPRNPVYIRPIWGYWSNRSPLVSIANTLALTAAGIDATSASPSAQVTVERGSDGLPTGRFLEDTRMSVVEMSLMAAAPGFTLSDRIGALESAMQVYNGFGTTSVYEGHGAAADVIAAYQHVRATGRQSVRASLVLSPAWGADPASDDIPRMLRNWAGWAAGRGFGDDWIRLQGVYAEQDGSIERALRAGAAPQTGWAGFNYDSSLPPALMHEFLLEAARNRFRVSTIFADVSAHFARIDRQFPIADLRWARGHISTLTASEIAEARDLGLVLVTHTNRHIAKMGSAHLARLGPEGANRIVPLRSLHDAGVPVALGSDNLPPSLFWPIADTVFRRDQTTGDVIAPDQALSRVEALAAATRGGAWLLGAEDRLGRIAPGYLADIIAIDGNVLTMDEPSLRSAIARTVIVGGKDVTARNHPGA
ncbi:MAG: amidohydrolase family protein [Pararhodobacter sp.]|nr:amidohydrolase family protein [Pararhodobacter sp.]